MANYVDSVERDGAHWLRPGEKVLAAAKVLGSTVSGALVGASTTGVRAVPDDAVTLAPAVRMRPGDEPLHGAPLAAGERGCVALTTSRLVIGTTRGILERPRELRLALDADQLESVHVSDGYGGPWSQLRVRLAGGVELGFDVSSQHDAHRLAHAIRG